MNSAIIMLLLFPADDTVEMVTTPSYPVVIGADNTYLKLIGPPGINSIDGPDNSFIVLRNQ